MTSVVLTSWAAREAWAAPGVLFVVRAERPDGERLWVVSAEPRIWLSAELADQLRCRSSDDGRHPDVTFTGPPTADDVTGWVLTVDAVNQRAVYVVRRYVFDVDCWEAEWPD